MDAAAAPSFPSTKETTNYAREVFFIKYNGYIENFNNTKQGHHAAAAPSFPSTKETTNYAGEVFLL